MKSKNILVTGGAGFVGSNLCEKLVGLEYSVICLDNFDNYYNPKIKKQNIKNLLKSQRFELINGDVRNQKKIKSIFKSNHPDYIVHLAALAGVRASIKHANEYIDVNVGGTINLLNAAKAYDVKNFLLASTSSIYGSDSKLPFTESEPSNKPLAPYPASKKAAELIAHSYYNLFNLNITSLRFFTAYGPRVRPDMMSYTVIDKIVKGEEITIFDNSKMKRDWTYIDDVCNGIVSAIGKPLGYEIVNIGRGQAVLLSSFIKTLEKVIGKKAKIKIVKTPLSEPQETFANIKKAQKLFNYNPKTSIEEGLKKTWEWYLESRNLLHSKSDF